MHPQTPCCHNLQGPARGPRGPGPMRVPRHSARRSRGTRGGQTCAATPGPPCSRRRTATAVGSLVLTLLRPGGPTPASVAAGRRRAGHHGQPGHRPVVQPGPAALPHVQAAARWVRLGGRRAWVATALAGPSRLGLGGVLSPPRDLALRTPVVPLLRTWGRNQAPLVCGAGLARAVTAVLRVGRQPLRPGRRGRPRVVRAAGVLLGHLVKRSGQRRGASGARRVVRGTEAASATVLAASHRGPVSETADSERLTATCRASSAPLARRGRALAPTETVLSAGRWLVGCPENCCWWHERLRRRAPAGAPWQWPERPPAMAAGLTTHRWPMPDLRCCQVPRSPWAAPKRRGRPPTRAQPIALALAAEPR